MVFFLFCKKNFDLFIIAHQAVLRALLGWCLDLQLEEIPFLDVPLHTLIRLEATTYGCREKRIKIIVDKELGATLEEP